MVPSHHVDSVNQTQPGLLEEQQLLFSPGPEMLTLNKSHSWLFSAEQEQQAGCDL